MVTRYSLITILLIIVVGVAGLAFGTGTADVL